MTDRRSLVNIPLDIGKAPRVAVGPMRDTAGASDRNRRLDFGSTRKAEVRTRGRVGEPSAARPVDSACYLIARSGRLSTNSCEAAGLLLGSENSGYFSDSVEFFWIGLGFLIALAFRDNGVEFVIR